MGVTIDSLQIEIQSSSTNAAKGIDDLAKSLEGLKKNGSFKTVSTNLNHLSGALKALPNVYSASNSLRTLANSIEKLKGVGSISSISNSISKLPVALKSLSTIDLTKTKSQMDDVADAVSSLSAIKAGGLSTMVNAIKNLGKLNFDEVAKNLDDASIKNFVDGVKRLNEELGPLSQKMVSVKSGFAAINSGARQAASGVKDFDAGINISSLNLSNLIEVVRTTADQIMNLVRVFTEFIHDATQWDGIEYQFGNAFGEQADLYYEKITKITDALRINKQMFMENSAMATSMLIGFGVNEADAREMGLGYTELAYDIWAAYNNVYEKIDGADGAMAAVRSAIAGEVEPIRRAGFTIVESQLEQTAANHGLKISIESATEAQKSYLRYLELVDQAHAKGIVGTYASEMETAEGMLRMLNQQWKSLTQSFASLFIPILVKVLPYIQAFVDLLKEGVYWLAELLGVEIQAVDFSDFKTGSNALDNVADSAGGATDALGSATKAAKELKNATLGIDELNVISPSSASSGVGGGAGSGSGSDGFAGLDVGSLWDESIFDTVKSDVDAIKEKMRGWMPIIASVVAGLTGMRLLGLIEDLKIVDDFKAFAKWGKQFGGLSKKFTGFVTAFAQLAKEGGIIATLAAAFPQISGWISSIAPVITGAAKAVGAFFAGLSGIAWAAIAAAIVAIGSAIYFVVHNFQELKAAAVDFFKENIAPQLEEIVGHFKKMGEALEPLWIAVEPIFSGIIDFVKSLDWAGFGKLLLNIVEVIGAVVVGFFGSQMVGFLMAGIALWENFFQVISGAVQIVAGFVEFWVALFTGDDLTEPIKKMVDGIIYSFVGLLGMVVEPITAFVDGVIDFFVYLWDVLVGHSIVPDTIDAIVKWFTSLPSKIFSSIDKFVTGIVDKFKGLWSKLVSWWNGKTTLKAYTPSIGSIYEKVKERWDSARTWWNEKKSAMKSYTPSIGSIYEKVYDRWKNARDWWNSKKGSFKSYTPSIGSITDKLKSAWNSAKSWWNKNVKLSTKLNIQVPTIKVKWDTASAFGKSFKYPTGFSLKFAANGGIFDQGSLIWAGERGPEIMANAGGGKTGVMNIQQMQEAVYEGVYSAVVAAMRGSSGGGTQAVNVYLDGRQITAAVEQRQHERGASIMGNEVYSY